MEVPIPLDTARVSRDPLLLRVIRLGYFSDETTGTGTEEVLPSPRDGGTVISTRGGLRTRLRDVRD